jgi:hypothetical protein
VNLGFHELGHLIFYVVPVDSVITAAAGSANQCLVPIAFGAYFLTWRRERFAGAAGLAWAATNCQEAAVYIASSPRRLEPAGERFGV